MSVALSAPLPPRSGEGEGRERAARPRRRANGPSICHRRALAAARVEDGHADTIPVRQHLRVPEADHAPARALKVGRTPGVIRDLVGMLSAIDLDDELR